MSEVKKEASTENELVKALGHVAPALSSAQEEEGLPEKQQLPIKKRA